MELILASASLGRKKILESLGIPFKISPSKIDEAKITASNPKLLVQKIAKKKAEAVAKRVKETSPSLILAADSTVVLGKKIIGKPKNKKEARRILRALSGKTHLFVTGLYLINTRTKKTWQKFSQSKVTFRKLKDEEVDEYIKKNPVTRFAGGYAINLEKVQKGQSEIIKKIDGSLTNVIGLPLEVLLPILRENGISKLKM